MKTQQLTIGLFGFGCVGQGLWKALHSTCGIHATIKKICVKDKTKERSIPLHHFSFCSRDILDDETIDVVVELIDDAEEAFVIVREALKKGKAVVTANKKMLALHFEELFELQQHYDTPLLYEAAVCGSIPLIRSLEEYYDNDLLTSLKGIVNGTTNYIFTKMSEEGSSYAQALEQAQYLGFAESNPLLDVSGMDATYKTSLLVAHSFGVFVPPLHIVHTGIHSASPADIAFAHSNHCSLKLVSNILRSEDALHAFVLPAFLQKKSPLAAVKHEFNGVLLEAAFSDTQLYVGRGAGSLPTASAVLSDISALRYGYRYEYKKYYQPNKPIFSNNLHIDVYLRFHHQKDVERLKFSTIYQYHVHKEWTHLGEFANIVLGRVSLESLWQSGICDNPRVFLAEAGEIVGTENSMEMTTEEKYIANKIVVA